VDNVTDLDEYRNRGGSTRPTVIVREKDGSVVLNVVAELSPEEARDLAGHLVEAADLIEDDA
jgi:hypothetical protein